MKGERLPLLRDVLADPATAWARVTVPGWYDEGVREVDLATGTAVWHHSGLPVVPLRWVLVRAPLGRFAPQALLSTDAALPASEVVGYFVRRWQLEVTFEAARGHLGVEIQQQWSDAAIARTTPVLLGLLSVVIPCWPRASCGTGGCPSARRRGTPSPRPRSVTRSRRCAPTGGGGSVSAPRSLMRICSNSRGASSSA